MPTNVCSGIGFAISKNGEGYQNIFLLSFFNVCIDINFTIQMNAENGYKQRSNATVKTLPKRQS